MTISWLNDFDDHNKVITFSIINAYRKKVINMGCKKKGKGKGKGK